MKMAMGFHFTKVMQILGKDILSPEYGAMHLLKSLNQTIF